MVSLLEELALFDKQNEKINGKDIIRQECIDRIGKLYKPAELVGVNMNIMFIESIEN